MVLECQILLVRAPIVEELAISLSVNCCIESHSKGGHGLPHRVGEGMQICACIVTAAA